MWKDVLGHDRQKGHLREAVISGKLPHTLLFCGPAGVGKTLVAVELFKALACLTHPGEACDTCRSCLKIISGTHPDLKVLDPPPSGKQVDLVRAFLAESTLRPFEARRKMIIIEPAERLNPSSANALLKALEEPPDSTVFVLVSHRPSLLLPTIVSRCQALRFTPLEGEALTRPIDPFLLRLTSGTIGGLGEVDASEVLGMRAAVMRLLRGADPHAVLPDLLPLTDEDRESLPLRLAVVEAVLRDMLVLEQGGNNLIHADLGDIPLAPHGTASLERTLQSVQDIKRGLIDNLNAKAALGSLLIQLSHLAASRE